MRNVMRNAWTAGRFRYVETPETVERLPSKGFTPKYRVTKQVVDRLRTIERLDEELQRHDLDDATTMRVLRDAVARNAFGTASIEGNPHTLEQVQSLLARGPTPERVSAPSEKEFHLYAQFLLHLEDVSFPRTVEEICALHQRLLGGVIPDPGRLKTRPNFIGENATRTVVFVPTLPTFVRRELKALLTWFHDADEHPIVKTALFFHEFQSIHPFLDGNGRVGRALSALALWSQGYHGVRFAVVDFAFNNDRQNYYDGLQGARVKRDLTVWLDYMVPILEDSFRDAVRRFLLAGALPRGLVDRTVRVAEAAARLDSDNPGRRFKFADMHAIFPQVPQRTLQLDLSRLVQAGVLELKGTRKAATYRFAFGKE